MALQRPQPDPDPPARSTTLNPHMFRAYDIRGVVGDDLNAEVAELIGRAYGTHLRRAYNVDQMVLGRDNRPSSESLRDGLAAGVRAAGVSVVDIGLSPSPLLYFAAAAWGVDGGANITGSHNPSHMNGVKMLEREGIPLAPPRSRRCASSPTAATSRAAKAHGMSATPSPNTGTSWAGASRWAAPSKSSPIPAMGSPPSRGPRPCAASAARSSKSTRSSTGPTRTTSPTPKTPAP